MILANFSIWTDRFRGSVQWFYRLFFIFFNPNPYLVAMCLHCPLRKTWRNSSGIWEQSNDSLPRHLQAGLQCRDHKSEHETVWTESKQIKKNRSYLIIRWSMLRRDGYKIIPSPFGCFEYLVPPRLVALNIGHPDPATGIRDLWAMVITGNQNA